MSASSSTPQIDVDLHRDGLKIGTCFTGALRQFPIDFFNPGDEQLVAGVIVVPLFVAVLLLGARGFAAGLPKNDTSRE